MWVMNKSSVKNKHGPNLKLIIFNTNIMNAKRIIKNSNRGKLSKGIIGLCPYDKNIARL